MTSDLAEGDTVQGDRTFVDHAGTWITKDGWTRREVGGRPSYVRCNCCDAPVERVTADGHSWCDDCAVPDAEGTPVQRTFRPQAAPSKNVPKD